MLLILFFFSLVADNDKSALLFAEFLTALKSAEVDENGIIKLECSKQALKISQLPQINIGPGSKLMLLRETYKEIFGEIFDQFKHGRSMSDQVCVLGTAGIGKSSFRYFILRQWLRGEIEIQFKSVLINMDELFYVVSRDPDGNVEVTAVPKDWHDMDALALLDPCSSLNGKALMFKMLIITTSSSPLTEQAKTCSLSERFKLCSSYVMGLWTLSELKLIQPQIDDDILRKFSFVENGVVCCVPRWFFYTPKQLKQQLNDCVSHVKRNALQSWFISNPADRVMDHRLPYRLCVIRQNEETRWEAYRFLSDYVCEFVLDRVVTLSSLQRNQFLNMIMNPFARGLFGTMFENWAFTSLSEGATLVISETPIIDFRFSAAGHINARKGIVPLQDNMIYRAAPGFPSIDGCGLVKNTLLLIQTTVSPTHSDAEWTHIQHIVSSVGKDVTSALMVYLVPKGSAFTLPLCQSLNAHKIPFKVCRGEISGEDFYKTIASKFKITVQAARGGG